MVATAGVPVAVALENPAIPIEAASDSPSVVPGFVPAMMITSSVSDFPSDVPSDAPSDIPSQAPGFFTEATFIVRLENVTTSFTMADQLAFAAATKDFLTEELGSDMDFVVTVMFTTVVTRRRTRRLENGDMELGVSVKASTLASDECLTETVLDALDTSAYLTEVRSAFADISDLNVAADTDDSASSGKGKGKGGKGKGACSSGKGKGGKSGSGKSGRRARHLARKGIHMRHY